MMKRLLAWIVPARIWREMWTVLDYPADGRIEDVVIYTRVLVHRELMLLYVNGSLDERSEPGTTE